MIWYDKIRYDMIWYDMICIYIYINLHIHIFYLFICLFVNHVNLFIYLSIYLFIYLFIYVLFIYLYMGISYIHKNANVYFIFFQDASGRTPPLVNERCSSCCSTDGSEKNSQFINSWKNMVDIYPEMVWYGNAYTHTHTYI